MPADIGFVKIDIGVLQTAEFAEIEYRKLAGFEHDFVGSPDDFLAEGTEKIIMIRSCPKKRLLNDFIDIAERKVVLGC